MSDVSRRADEAEDSQPPEPSNQPSLPTPRTEPDPDAQEGRRSPPDLKPPEHRSDRRR